MTEIKKIFCTSGKHMKFATKPIRHFPPYLRHFAALPWEIKNLFFSDIEQIWKKMNDVNKKFVFEGVHNKQLKKLQNTGTVDRQPGTDIPRSACTEENVDTVND